MSFTAPLSDGESYTDDNGVTFTVTIQGDDDADAPWDREDGHGPVSEWTTRDKLPGEIVLNTDRDRKRFYNYAEACRIARADGWGTLAPYRMAQTIQASDGTWLASATCYSKGTIHGIGSDINEAIRALRAAHRASYPSARAYAAAAAMSDYERLRQWCNDVWSYVGVTVTATDADGDEIGEASLWGIESDASDYLAEVANELASECLA